MRKDIIIGTLLLILGFVLGLMCRKDHIREVTNMSQNDTIVRLDTIKHSRFELVRNTYELDIPKISRPELVYIPADSATIIYRDSVRYVTMPRQYFYTKTDDAEIWHSGIDSTIDSLNVVRKTQKITKATQTVTKCNTLALGFEMQYTGATSLPIYLEYSHLLHKNIEIFGKVLFDVPTQQFGVGLGLEFQLGW